MHAERQPRIQKLEGGPKETCSVKKAHSLPLLAQPDLVKTDWRQIITFYSGQLSILILRYLRENANRYVTHVTENLRYSFWEQYYFKENFELDHVLLSVLLALSHSSSEKSKYHCFYIFMRKQEMHATLCQANHLVLKIRSCSSVSLPFTEEESMYKIN